MAVDCLPCEKNGQKGIEGKGATVTFDPAIQMPGSPTITGRRLGAEFLARLVHRFGVQYVVKHYAVSREECLVACWWAGMFGPRKWRKEFGEWAKTEAAPHLWYRCIAFPDPPSLKEEG